MAAIAALQVPHLSRLSNKSNTASVAELKTEVESERLRLNLLKKFPSFGFDNLVADWFFLNFVQYFGDDAARAKTGYNLSPEYFEIILARDPYFLDAYFFFSGSTTLYAGMPELTVALMEKDLSGTAALLVALLIHELPVVELHLFPEFLTTVFLQFGAAC